jgi:3',5'-cyclic-AMP phosphodiesterase
MSKASIHNDPFESQSNSQQYSISPDGIDRRGFLRCMAWAGTGLIWSFAGGVPVSQVFGQSQRLIKPADFSFIQISDSHIGFNKAANPDVTGTFQAALDKIDAAPATPDFLIHTGDLTHSSKPAEFDTLAQMLGSKRQVFYVPGEHDTSVDDGKMYLERYGKNTRGSGWYSFDQQMAHRSRLPRPQ